jgi:DNA-binding beta-propeller fold protein YncE
MGHHTSGALTIGPSLQVTVGTDAVTVDPLGRFLYVDNQNGNGAVATATVLTYTIETSTGALTAIGSGMVVGSDSTAPSDGFELVAEPTGNYLYVISNFNYSAAADNIFTLAINPTTGASSLIGSAVPIGSNPFGAVCDPSGQFLYTANFEPEYWNCDRRVNKI